MANLTEVAQWEPGVVEFAVADLLRGGPGGEMNRQAQQIANRIAWLRSMLLNGIGGVHNVMDSAYQATGNGVSDDTTPIMDAIDDVAVAGRGIVVIPGGTFLFTSLVIPASGIRFLLAGKGVTTLRCKTPGAGITASVGLDGFQFVGGCTYDLSGAPAAVDGFDFIYGLNHANIADITWNIDNNTRHGIRVRGSPDGVAANGRQFDNTFSRFNVTGSGPATGSCVYFNGYDIEDARCNGNTIEDCDFNHWTNDVRINGAGNNLRGNTYGNATDALLYEGDQTNCNQQIGEYFDDSVTNTVNIQVSAGISPVFIDIGSNGLGNGRGITDANPNASGLPRYALVDALQAMLVQLAFRPNLNDDTTAWNVGLQTPAGTGADSHLLIFRAGSNSARSGKLILSGKDYAGGTNAVGNHGSVSAVIDANGGDGSFRVAKTPDGSSHSQLFDVNVDGYISGLPDSAAGSVGQVALAAASSTAVANPSVTVNSRVYFSERNASAGNLRKDHGINVSVTAGVGLTFIVSDGTPAAGTEVFDWFVVN